MNDLDLGFDDLADLDLELPARLAGLATGLDTEHAVEAAFQAIVDEAFGPDADF